jgi:hypothetical protein
LLFFFIYSMCIVCFRPADCRIESELSKKFQDLDFEDIKQQQVEFEGKCH